MDSRRSWWTWALAGLALVLVLGFGLDRLSGGEDKPRAEGGKSGPPTLTFYTTGLATTPQLALWAAQVQGRLDDLCRLEVHQWKDVDDLRGVVLAGKGDLWLGHCEGFAQAARHGAPVSLLVISGWRKFYLLSREAGCDSLAHFAGRDLAVTPVGSPAMPILRALWPSGLPPIRFLPQDPKQMALSLMQGRVGSALVPEPLVTVLLTKAPDLKVKQSLEDEYGRLTKGPARMPMAGLAVNTRTAARHPGLMDRLVQILVETSQEVAADPEMGIQALPVSFGKFVSKEMVRASLARDLILVEPACRVEKELAAFLGLVYPPALDSKGRLALGEKFLWPCPAK